MFYCKSDLSSKTTTKVVFSPQSLASRYGVIIDARSASENGDITCKLLCSKSKVAPLSVLSIARLELCAAVLLSQLAAHKVSSALPVHIDEIFLWTDSTIVLQYRVHIKY